MAPASFCLCTSEPGIEKPVCVELELLLSPVALTELKLEFTAALTVLICSDPVTIDFGCSPGTSSFDCALDTFERVSFRLDIVLLTSSFTSSGVPSVENETEPLATDAPASSTEPKPIIAFNAVVSSTPSSIPASISVAKLSTTVLWAVVSSSSGAPATSERTEANWSSSFFCGRVVPRVFVIADAMLSLRADAPSAPLPLPVCNKRRLLAAPLPDLDNTVIPCRSASVLPVPIASSIAPKDSSRFGLPMSDTFAEMVELAPRLSTMLATIKTV
mmetsp:Transcript_35845/g.93427  ORF Transcript_35845/g.93427 Transcript_35845/m.93427 type:complete len:274 (-) Transcript_35845:149-970(-)